MTRNLTSRAPALAAAIAAAFLANLQPAFSQTAEGTAPPAETAEATAAADEQATAAAEESVVEDSSAEQAVDQAQAEAAAQADTSAAADATAPPTTTPQLDQSQNQADLQGQAQINAGAAAPAQADLQGQTGVGGQAGVAGQAATAIQGDAGVQAGAAQVPSSNFGLQFGAATTRGLTVDTVDRNSLFFNSGLRPRDILVTFNGQPLRSPVEFQRYVMQYPGQRIPVVVLRDGRPQTIYVIIDRNQLQPAFPNAEASRVAQAYLGVTFDAQFANAAIVRSVAPSSPADQAGLRAGDMIRGLNGLRVASAQDVVRIIGRMQPGQRVAIDYSRRIHSRADAVLAGGPSQVPYTVGYPPPAAIEPPVAPQTTTVQPEAPTGVYEPGAAPRLYDNARPGDADNDGRLFDGDGRARRRDR